MSTTDHGFGSVYQRSSDGRWMASVEMPENGVTGKRRRKMLSAATREEVEARLIAYRAENPPLRQSRDSQGTRQGNLERGRALGHHTDLEWRQLVGRVGGKCEYCGVVTIWITKSGRARGPNRRTRDHRTPLAAGGSNSIDNMALACGWCNDHKGLMDEPTYRVWLADYIIRNGPPQ